MAGTEPSKAIASSLGEPRLPRLRPRCPFVPRSAAARCGSTRSRTPLLQTRLRRTPSGVRCGSGRTGRPGGQASRTPGNGRRTGTRVCDLGCWELARRSKELNAAVMLAPDLMGVEDGDRRARPSADVARMLRRGVGQPEDLEVPGPHEIGGVNVRGGAGRGGCNGAQGRRIE